MTRSDVMSLTPQERTLRARLGAFALHATHDAAETTAAARRSFMSRFEREVDPEMVLPQAERQRRAEYAKHAYFARLALSSARKRKRRAAEKNKEDAALGKAAPTLDRRSGGEAATGKPSA